MMNDVFNIGISEGGVHRLLDCFAERATPLYQTIRQRVSASKVVGTDETGAKVNGAKHWFWTWQTTDLIYIAHSATRGKAVIDASFPHGFLGATLVRDGWRAQTGTAAKHPQACLPHLFRHLNYLNDKYDGTRWGSNLKILLYDAMEIGKGGTGNTDVRRAEIARRLKRFLERPPDEGQKELFTFYKLIRRERRNLFTFLYLEDVISDNNASERAISNIKVKQKISGQFKTEKAARNFAMIRSVIDTTIKNGMGILEALALISKLRPQTID